MLQKLNKLAYKVLSHPPYSPDLLPTNYHFFKHLDNFFAGKMLPKPAAAAAAAAAAAKSTSVVSDPQ